MPSFNQQAQEIMDTIGEVSQIPGGIEMLITMAAEKNQGSGGKTRQLRLYNRGGPVEYESGGLAAAEDVRQMGRGDDEVLLHVSPEEYEAITAMWGEPDINPNTGLPEYGFLSKLWKKVKKGLKKIVKSPIFQFVAPIALNAFVPGLGAAIGGKLGLAGKMASTVGNAAVRGALGAAGGGKEGALSGVVNSLTMGGVGSDIGSKLGLTGGLAKHAGNALIGGAGGVAGGGGFTQGALGNVANAAMMQPMEEATSKALGTVFDPQSPMLGGGEMTGEMSPLPGGPQMSPVPGGATQMTDLMGSQDLPWYKDAWNWAKDNPLLAAGGAGLLYSSLSGGDDQGPPQWQTGSGEFMEPLSTDYNFSRSFQGLDPEAYYTYGQTGAPQMGEHQFIGNNQIGQPGSAEGQPLVQKDFNLPPGAGLKEMMAALVAQGQPGGFAEGGYVGYAGGGPLGYARGAGSGRDDTIEALLSDGEFVMDAETVSLLGDGSNNEGAKRLEELRQNLRKHKGAGLAKGRISPNARRPEHYMRKKRGGSVNKKRFIRQLERKLGD